MLPEPFCQFCRHDDGSLDYNELHAIEVGIADGLFPWTSEVHAWLLYEKDWHYYRVARRFTTTLATIVLAVGLILLTRSLL